MSSYQFVNSLAACYNGSRGGPDPNATNDYYPGAPAASSGAAGGGAAGSTYPNCYSPATAAQANYYGGSPTHHVTNLSNGSDYRTNAPPGLNGGSVLPLTSSLTNNPSCKYASPALNNNNSTTNNNNSGANNPTNIVSSGGGSGANASAVVAAAAAAAALVGLDTGLANCGSPQDLTTNSNGSSASSSVCSTPRSPPLGSGGSSTGGRSQNSQNSQSNSSHNSTSPNSNNGNQSQSGNTKGSSGNPPQIYPWMKRVHLGQSKFVIIWSCHTLLQ